MDPIMYLLLGHFVGDFALQSDYMAQKKTNSKKTLTFHVLVYVLVIAAVLVLYGLATGKGHLFSWTGLGVLVLLYVAHWLQDYLKGHVLPKSKQMYYLDQILHISLLYLIRLVLY